MTASTVIMEEPPSELSRGKSPKWAAVVSRAGKSRCCTGEFAGRFLRERSFARIQYTAHAMTTTIRQPRTTFIHRGAFKNVKSELCELAGTAIVGLPVGEEVGGKVSIVGIGVGDVVGPLVGL